MENLNKIVSRTFPYLTWAPKEKMQEQERQKQFQSEVKSSPQTRSHCRWEVRRKIIFNTIPPQKSREQQVVSPNNSPLLALGPDPLL